MALDSTMLNAMMMISASRTGASAGSSQLVAHAVYIHAHQTAMNITSVCDAPTRVWWASR